VAPQILPNYGPFDLKSAVVLITGGSSGIGQGLAEEFLKAGSTVIVTGRRESALKKTQANAIEIAHKDVGEVVNADKTSEDEQDLNLLCERTSLSLSLSCSRDQTRTALSLALSSVTPVIACITCSSMAVSLCLLAADSVIAFSNFV